jgi:hypothetical protein
MEEQNYRAIFEIGSAGMLENRFGELFEESQVPPPSEYERLPGAPTVFVAPPSGPFASMNAIYQAAYERALRDHQLDVLFNPDFYGDHGSGI